MENSNIDENISQEQVAEMMKAFKDIKESIDNGSAKFDVATFTRAYAEAYYGTIGAYTPDMTNSVMKSININPLQATVDNIDKALNDVKSNDTNLVGYCQDMYMKSMLYKRNFDYLNLLPSWDLSIECVNASEGDYKRKAFLADYNRVKEFLSKFNYRDEFNKAFFNMLNAEIYPCIFRMDMCDSKYVLQDFPYSYSKITGRSTWGLYYDIDMTYFLQPSVDINMYPKWIKKTYQELFKGKPSQQYIPSNSSGSRDGVFAMWTQTSFEDGFWCFKFKNDIVANIPYFSAMLPDLILLPVFRKLQLSQSISAARKIIGSQWPLLKDQKGAITSDMLAVKPDTMGRLMGVFAKNLEESFKILNMPSDKMEQFEFENTDKDAYNNFLKITSSLMGGGNVLFNTQKNNVAETNLSLSIDEMLATSIYPQFENFLEYYASQITKTFKFKFKFSGTNSYVNKDHRYKQAFESAAKGVVCINKIANSLGMNIFELENELDMTKGLGFTDKLMPMLNMYTQTGDMKDAKRPQKSETELTESGITTRSAGSNLARGGEV